VSETKTMPPRLLLEARHLVKDYGAVRVIDDVSLDLVRGETLGLVGESGSGKTTVARMLLRLIEPTAGEVRYRAEDGREFDLRGVSTKTMRGLRRKLAIVFQDPYAALNPRMNVRQILSEPFAIHGEQPAQGLDVRLKEMLAEVGLEPSALTRAR
jgi:ABC-type microcin C transport system duplicated ATPase subunit YejF